MPFQLSEKEALIGCVLVAESCAREGVEGDKIDEAVNAIHGLKLFADWNGDQISKTWLRLKDEIFDAGLEDFLVAVQTQTNHTAKAQIVRICFDLIALNPLLNVGDHFYLKMLISRFGLPANALDALWKRGNAVQQYENYENALLGITLQQPKGWLLTEGYNGLHVLSIKSPRSNSTDQFTEFISLAFDEAAKDLDIDALYDQGVGDWTDICKDFQVLRNGAFHIPQQEIHARWKVFSGQAPKWVTPLTVKFFSFVSDKHALRYTLGCYSMHESTHEYEDIFDHVAKSIVIQRG